MPQFEGWHVDLNKARGSKMPLRQERKEVDFAGFRGGKNGVYLLVLTLAWGARGATARAQRVYDALCADLAWLLDTLAEEAIGTYDEPEPESKKRKVKGGASSTGSK